MYFKLNLVLALVKCTKSKFKLNQLYDNNTMSIEGYENSKLTHFSFSINSCYAIFDKSILSWIPKTQNLYFDSMEFLTYQPNQFNSRIP